MPEAYESLPADARYWLYRPRGFRNEYEIFITTEEISTSIMKKAGLAGAYNITQITRQEAYEWGWELPKQAREEGRQWYGGWFDLLTNFGIPFHQMNIDNIVEDTKQFLYAQGITMIRGTRSYGP